MRHNEKYECIIIGMRYGDTERCVYPPKSLFVCGEMLLDLEKIEERRWKVWQLRRDLVARSIPVVTLSAFLLPKDVQWLEENSNRISKQWYLHGDRDWSLYRGVSLGKCLEYTTRARVMRRLKFMVTIKRLREAFPDKTMFIDYPVISEEYLISKQVVNDLRCLCNERPSHHYKVEPPRRSVKMHLAEAARYFLSLCLVYLSTMRSKEDDCKMPIVVVHPNPQMLQILNTAVGGGTQGTRFALSSISMSNLASLWRLFKAGVIFTVPQRSNEPLRYDEFVKIRTLWDACKVSPVYNELLTVEDVALQSVFTKLFDRLVQLDFRSLCAQVDHSYEILSSPRITALVLPNDCMPQMRTQALVAREIRKKIVAIQHGHLMYTGDENHLLADFSAFWSEMAARAFVEAGLSPRRIMITGSPNADILLAGHYSSRGVRDKPPWRVLIITAGNPGVQPYLDESADEDYIAGVLESLRGRRETFEICIKLHPGESLRLYRRYLKPIITDNVLFAHRADLGSLLSECDVVISPPSTVVLEARVMCRPVILIVSNAALTPNDTLSRVAGVFTLHDYAAIPAAIEMICSRGIRADDGQLDVTGLMGPLDGCSSRRLLDAINAVASL